MLWLDQVESNQGYQFVFLRKKMDWPILFLSVNKVLNVDSKCVKVSTFENSRFGKIPGNCASDHGKIMEKS